MKLTKKHLMIAVSIVLVVIIVVIIFKKIFRNVGYSKKLGLYKIESAGTPSSNYEPQFVKKEGTTCPAGTVDYEDGRCLSSEFGPLVWVVRPVPKTPFNNSGTEAEWTCPAGMTQDNSPVEWNKRCKKNTVVVV
jgi:type IV secretory pathway protease TraF